jgi:hypothetical protein
MYPIIYTYVMNEPISVGVYFHIALILISFFVLLHFHANN